MQVDKTTLHDIGLFDRDETIGLITTLNFCKTNGGSDLFKKLLLAPLSNQSFIEERQNALTLLIEIQPFIKKMQITNGTCLVIEKFFDTPFKEAPSNIGQLGAYWYRYWENADYSLIQYSVGHLLLFIQELKNISEKLRDEKENKIILKIVDAINTYIQEPFLESASASFHLKNPQNVLQIASFFLNQYKYNTQLLLATFYELDALYSMATANIEYHFEFPKWQDKDCPSIYIEAAFHPLVEAPIANTITLSSEHNFLFLTGANMAGKSTYIKTVGIAVYLAHIGMGLPGKNAQLTILEGLITNLNIADNVVKGESYFFNEVQRIKLTLEKVMSGKKYLVLIDELFKGTNIVDAMKCSIGVIEGLQKLNTSLFILSTHLYEIADSLKKYNNIQFNYFETQINNKELDFNYQLKEGVSQDRIGYLILEREGVIDLLSSINT